MRRLDRMRLVIMVGAFFLMAESTQLLGGELSKEERALLDSVRVAREITMSQVTSGRIVAVTSEKEASGNEPMTVSVPQHQIDVTFAGNDSMVWQWQGNDDGKLNNVLLHKDGRKVTYTPPGNKAMSSLHIEAEDRGAIFHPPLRKWTFREIAGVNMSTPDSVFWSAVYERYPVVRVEKNGTTVRLALEMASEEHGILHESRVIDFDMSAGGMICHWSRNRKEKREGEEVIMDETGEVDWQYTAERCIPVRRTTTLTGMKGGTPFFKHESETEFVNLSVEDIPLDELSIERMGVAVGTPVVDQIIGAEYRYEAGGKFGDAIDRLPDNIVSMTASATASSQDAHQEKDNEQLRVDRGLNSAEHPEVEQPNSEFPSTKLAIGTGVLVALIISGWFLARKSRRR